MIISVIISPIVLVIFGAIILLNLPVWAVIALVVITALALMGSLAICAAISSRMAPKVRGYQVFGTEHLPTASYTVTTDSAQPTEVFGSPQTYPVAPQQTYKRMIGRRVVEFDAATHEPVDPDQTSLIWKVKDR